MVSGHPGKSFHYNAESLHSGHVLDHKDLRFETSDDAMSFKIKLISIFQPRVRKVGTWKRRRDHKAPELALKKKPRDIAFIDRSVSCICQCGTGVRFEFIGLYNIQSCLPEPTVEPSCSREQAFYCIILFIKLIDHVFDRHLMVFFCFFHKTLLSACGGAFLLIFVVVLAIFFCTVCASDLSCFFRCNISPHFSVPVRVIPQDICRIAHAIAISKMTYRCICRKQGYLWIISVHGRVSASDAQSPVCYTFFAYVIHIFSFCRLCCYINIL